ncbi:MAG: spermidine synthase [Desulfurococcales archaeon ex4484_58]|nr:MAG: spermidine synthase [Desulfurococcales archaeon ex4484_58]
MFRIKKIYAYEKSKYQEIMLVDIEGFGKSLVIDNLIQSTEKDEYIYHESLVHPAMILHPEPKNILIIGGGEGATLREVLKHNTVKRAVMVDIDEVVVNFARKYLEYMHQGSFEDERAEIVIMDGYEYIRKAPSESYDVVILDLTDPYAGEIAKKLYSEEFYRETYRILRGDGVMVTQAGNSFFYNKTYKYVYENIEKVYPQIIEYWVWVPSFTYTCNFVLASKTYDPRKISIEEFDERLCERGVNTRFINGKRYYSLIYMGVIIGDLEK